MAENNKEYNEEVITKLIDDCAKSGLEDLDSEIFSNLFVKGFTFIKAYKEEIDKLKNLNNDFDIRNFKGDYYLISFIGKELNANQVKSHFDEIDSSDEELEPSKMDKEILSSNIKECQLTSMYFSRIGKYSDKEVIDNLNKLLYNVDYDSRYIRNIKKKIEESPYKAIIKILAENYC